MTLTQRTLAPDEPVVRALLDARFADPFAVLGLHTLSSETIVRTLQPGALAVEVIGKEGRATPLQRIGDSDLFAAKVPPDTRNGYRLRIHWSGAVQETADAYSFGPQLGDFDLHLITEGRREIGLPSWDGIVSSGLLALYLKPTENNLLRAWTAFAGGWRIQVPFQLRLEAENQRLIGYPAALHGGRRVAAGLLARHVLPGLTSRGDVGLGLFANAARLWAGDAPFGVNTPVLPSAGISLFAAAPKGSQRTLRIDVGTALRTGIVRSGWEVRLIYTAFTRTVLTEPGDILGAREQLIGPNVFRP
jgi:hypothetical protein